MSLVVQPYTSTSLVGRYTANGQKAPAIADDDTEARYCNFSERVSWLASPQSHHLKKRDCSDPRIFSAVLRGVVLTIPERLPGHIQTTRIMHRPYKRQSGIPSPQYRSQCEHGNVFDDSRSETEIELILRPLRLCVSVTHRRARQKVHHG